jgi:NAD-dependent histone deacetylase SIR2
LLGDADSIVSYLCRELGWEIPPPAAVVSSPRNETKSPSAGMELIDKVVPKVKIPPEEARWRSYVGDL